MTHRHNDSRITKSVACANNMTDCFILENLASLGENLFDKEENAQMDRLSHSDQYV